MLSFRHHLDHHSQDPLLRNPPHPPFFATNSPHSSTQPINTSDRHSNIDRRPDTALNNSSYMSSAYHFSGPAIRVQQSTPTPQPQQTATHPQNQGFPAYSNSWLYGSSDERNKASGFGGHQRTTSSSSVGSNSPANSFGHGIMYGGQSPALRKIDSSYSNAADESLRNYPNHLPTPTQTPTQDTFLASSTPSSYSQFQNFDSTMAAHSAMKHALSDGNSMLDDDAPGFSHSTRHSVSSFGRSSPATPRTVNGEDFDEGFKVPSNDLAVRPVQSAPKFERTLTDAYTDELFNPSSMPTSTPQKKNFSTLLSPYHNIMMNERLQQANQARSQSPTANGSRGVSPFRQGSPYAQTNSLTSPQSRLNAGTQLRHKQRNDAEAAALKQQGMNAQDSEPKTISPKDAVLDYHESEEDAKMPLFSDTDNTQFNSYASNFSQGMPSKSDMSYDSITAGVAINGWSNPTGSNPLTAYSAASTTTPSQAQFNFAPSSVPGMFHSLPTTTFGSTSLVASSEETPEFPAHLTSMESSASEAPPQSSQNSNVAEPSKPALTLADTGTYTCTYHGCTQRFETPQKLQRHKREAHRQSNVVQPVQGTPPTPGVGSGMTSAALAARNSQAGPHKCGRINPTTGKPCNTIFSRPYDLTRHEDTIHNIRKQKVRCALCQEEKTFSRNDALTRHMRVVHPDVDFPGKHRKRGGHSDD